MRATGSPIGAPATSNSRAAPAPDAEAATVRPAPSTASSPAATRRPANRALRARDATVSRLGHLGVDDAAAGRHPLHAARLEQVAVADAVAVLHEAPEHDGDRLEAAVRVVGEP